MSDGRCAWRVLPPPLVGALDGVGDRLPRLGVRLPCDARLHVDVEDPGADRFGVDLLRVGNVEAAGPLQAIGRSIQIVDKRDGRRPFPRDGSAASPFASRSTRVVSSRRACSRSALSALMRISCHATWPSISRITIAMNVLVVRSRDDAE